MSLHTRAAGPHTHIDTGTGTGTDTDTHLGLDDELLVVPRCLGGLGSGGSCLVALLLDRLLQFVHPQPHLRTHQVT